MKYIPFEKLGKFHFSNSDDKILDKTLGKYKEIRFGVQRENENEYTIIYIADLNLLIVFEEDEQSIRYMETTLEIQLEKCNLCKESLSGIQSKFSLLDKSLQTNDGGRIISEKYGFMVSNENSSDTNSIILFNHNALKEILANLDNISRHFMGDKKKKLEIKYFPEIGFQIESEMFHWKEDRLLIRSKLENQHSESDMSIDLSEFIGKSDPKNLEQRRDIYENINNTESSFFLNYNNEHKLSELEIHSGVKISINNIELDFQTDINECLNRLKKVDKNYTLTKEGQYLFKNLKMTIATSKSLGGEGNGLSYFYSSNNIDHLIE